MGEFPSPDELIGLFGGKPTVLNPSVPWLYNTLDFTAVRDGMEIRTRIVPSDELITVRLLLGGNEVAQFELHDVKDLRVVTEQGQEMLVIAFAPDRNLDVFVLQLKPHVRIAWGNAS